MVLMVRYMDLKELGKELIVFATLDERILGKIVEIRKIIQQIQSNVDEMDSQDLDYVLDVLDEIYRMINSLLNK